MEISKLKFFVKRIFGVPPRIQKLKLFDPEVRKFFINIKLKLDLEKLRKLKDF
jgi:hypothetical protein